MLVETPNSFNASIAEPTISSNYHEFPTHQNGFKEVSDRIDDKLNLPFKEKTTSTGNVKTEELFSLNGRFIIVTGGGGGLGLTATIAILESGADVMCLDLLQAPDKDEWDRAMLIAQRHGVELQYQRVDVTKVQALSDAFEVALVQARYPLRGVVTCAGVTQALPAIEYPVSEFRRIMDVNITGTFLTAQLAARVFLKQGLSGSIVMIASMSGSIANKGLSCVAYNSSKAAVHQMCRSMAAELSCHTQCPIRINTLSPGYIRTAMTDQLLRERPESAKLWFEGCMMNRLAEPEEFRGPLIFLLGDGSSFMTGADLRVDGGYCAW